MKTITTLGIVFISLLFIVSCKKEDSINLDQNRIYADYSVRYSQSANRTTAQALFRIDSRSGKKIELSYPSRVRFNGENMSWRNVLGLYEVERSGNTLNGLFEYFDIEENGLMNSATSLAPIDVPFGLNTISRNGNFFLPWTGAALASDEIVQVEISGGSQSSSRTFSTSVIGSNYIVLSQHDLNSLTPGTAQIQIMREYATGIQNSTLAGGRITSIYEGRKVTVNITE